MKKILLIPFLLFAALSMAACGGDSDEPFTSEQPEQPENPGGGDDSGKHTPDLLSLLNGLILLMLDSYPSARQSAAYMPHRRT